MAKSWRQRAWDLFKDEPVYAPAKPSDASLAEGWKIAYELERDLRISAEAALAELMPEVTEEDRDEMAFILSGESREDWAKEISGKTYFRLKADRLIRAGYRKIGK
jgi:hypothetical protein